MIDAFYNSGPFIIMNPSTGAQQSNLQYNTQSIISQTNILYIDVVAGTGFSTPQLNTYNDDQVANDAYLAIKQWLAMPAYSSYAHRGFNLMGTGYGGMIIPKVAVLLKNNNTQNFNGMLIGNPTFQYDATNRFNQSFQNMFKFLASHNFVDEVSMSAFTTCTQSTVAQADINPACAWLLQKFELNFFKGTNLWDIFGTNCYDDYLIPDMYRCLPLAPLKSLLTSATVATALHVSQPLSGWNSFFNKDLVQNYDFYYKSNVTTLQCLQTLIGNVKIWVYDSDASVLNSYTNTRFYLSQLNLGNITQAQKPYAFLESTLLQDQLAGYITRYQGFVYATVKKGNFWAGQQQPMQYYQLLKNYLQG